MTRKQADIKLQPRLVAGGMNGRPVLRFDEKRATRLELPDLSDKQITATVIAVVGNPLPGAEVNHDPRIFTASDGKGFDYQTGIALTVPGMETGGPRVLSGFFSNAGRSRCAWGASRRTRRRFSLATSPRSWSTVGRSSRRRKI